MGSDIEEFKSELKSSVREHYKNIKEKYFDIYAYSLFSADDIPSVGPVSNRLSSISVPPNDKLYNYYKYGAVEWSEWDDLGLFDNTNHILKYIVENSQDDWSDTKSTILEACLSVLSELDTEGVFGEKTDDRFIVIFLSDSDDHIMSKSAKLLNTENVYKSYAKEFS